MKSFTVCWVHQICGERFRRFFHHHLHSYIHGFQLYKTAMSISTKALRFSCEFSLAYSEMYESTLLTHVCEDFMLSRMIMQSQEEMKSYSCSESEIKQIANRFLGNVWQHITDTCVQDFTLPGWICSHRRRRATVAMSPRWNRSLTASLLAFSASYFLRLGRNPLDSSPLLWNISRLENFKNFHGVNFQQSKSLAGKTFAVY